MIGTGIRLALGMKLLSGLVFVIGAIVAGVMNRSFPVAILLAAAMTLAGVAARMRAGGGALSGLLGQAETEKKKPWDGALQGFILRALGLSFVFGLSVLISAIFQETDMEQRVGQTDLMIIGTCFALALVLSSVSQTLLAKQAEALSAMMGDIQTRFRDMQQGRTGGFPGDAGAPGRAANDDVIEGEFTRKDED